MAGTQSRYEWQFKQRLTSGGLNSQTAYLARNTSEAMHAFTGFDHETALQSGVIRGLMVSVVANTMRISVSPGIGQFRDSAISEPDSKSQWMELAAAVEKTVTAADAANPRWDVVEIQPAVVNGAAEIIDFYNPNDNTFSPAVVSVLKLSVAAVQVRAGTPGANPKFLAGVAGWVPLAYVYVGANVVELNADRVMDCRPILTPRRGVYRNEDPTSTSSPYGEAMNISGGGWEVAADGYTGSLATAMAGTFPNGGLPFSLPGNTTIQLVTAGNYEGGGLPAGNTVVHAYVAPPPYPAGYDASLAPRVLYIRDTTTPNVAATIPPGARNCIVLVSSSTPDQTSPLGTRGGPNSSTGTFTDNLWGAFTRVRATLLYIGAAYHAIGIPGLVTQRVKGSTVAPARKTGFDFEADLPIAGPTLYNLWSNISGDAAMSLPETARKCFMSAAFDNDGGGHLHMKLEDDWTGTSSLGVVAITHYNDAASTFRGGGTFVFHASASGAVTITQAAAQLIDGEQRMHVRAYEDCILAMR